MSRDYIIPAPMTADDFRSIALSVPDAVEASHMDHPDFRVGGMIASLSYPSPECGCLSVDPHERRKSR